MNLNELLSLYLKQNDLSEGFIFTAKNSINDVEINDFVGEFFRKLNQGEAIPAKDFATFNEHLNRLNPKVQEVMNYLIVQIANNIYQTHEKEIANSVATIDSSLKASKQIPQEKPNPKKFVGLVNIYQLLAKYKSIIKHKNEHLTTFPAVSFEQGKKLTDEIPFAVNALVLTGKLPKVADFNGINLTKGLYPLT